jgi:hypothetical protein
MFRMAVSSTAFALSPLMGSVAPQMSVEHPQCDKLCVRGMQSPVRYSPSLLRHKIQWE